MKSMATASSLSYHVVINHGALVLSARVRGMLVQKDSCVHTGSKDPCAQRSTSARNATEHRSSNQTSQRKSVTVCARRAGRQASTKNPRR